MSVKTQVPVVHFCCSLRQLLRSCVVEASEQNVNKQDSETIFSQFII